MDQLANETFPADEFRQVMDLTDDHDREEEKLAACQRLAVVMARNRPPRKEFRQYIDGIISGFRTTRSNILKVRLLQLLVQFVSRHEDEYSDSDSSYDYYSDDYYSDDYDVIEALDDDGPEYDFWLGLLSTMQEETHYLVDPNAVNIMAAFWVKYPEEVKELMTKHEYYDFNDLVLMKIGSSFYEGGMFRGFVDLLHAHVGDDERELTEWVSEHFDEINSRLFNDFRSVYGKNKIRGGIF